MSDNLESSSCDLLLVGGSVRAAAHSVLRAGYRPWAIDPFGDLDLRAVAPVLISRDFPYDLPKLAAQLPPAPFLYTGGLENYPEVLEELNSCRPLLGNSAAIVRAVRDPFQLASLPSLPGVRMPRVLPERTSLRVADGQRWLRKPFRSAGGCGIDWFSPVAEALPFDSASSGPSTAGASFYLQEYIPGEPLSALYVGNGSDARLLGVTLQIIGASWAHARPFQYVGNVAPFPLPETSLTAAVALGSQLARHFSLRGIFGVDLIYRDETLWLLEVNPRYTASIEVLERAGRMDAIRWHLAGCAGDLPPCQPLAARGKYHGKAVLYAPRAMACTAEFLEFCRQCNAEAATADSGSDSRPTWPAVADLSPEGTIFQPGDPVCTVFSGGGKRPEAGGGREEAGGGRP